MTYELYIYTGLIIVFSAALAIFDSLEKKKIVIAFAILICIFGFISLFRQCKKDEKNTTELKVEKDSLKLKEKKIVKYNSMMAVKTDSIKELQNKVVDSTHILLQKQSILLTNLNSSINIQNNLVLAQRETIKQILGDGYVIFYPKQNDNKVKFYGMPSANYSLYDVRIRISDHGKLKQIKPRYENNLKYLKIDTVVKYIKEFPEMALPPHMYENISFQVNKSELPKFLTFQATCRNITTLQYTIIFEENNEIHIGYKIFSAKNRKFKFIKEFGEKLGEDIWKKNFYYLNDEYFIE